MVYVDRNGQVSGAAEEKEQKNGTGKGIKKAEEDEGKNKKEHGEKDGLENGGYESDSKDKVNKRAANYGLSTSYYVSLLVTVNFIFTIESSKKKTERIIRNNLII